MRKLDKRTRRTLVSAAYALGVAAVIFLLPARLTTPLRTVFTETLGPIEEASFNLAGDALAASGTFLEAVFNRERCRLAEQEVLKLRVENAQLDETGRSLFFRLASIRDLQVKGFSSKLVSANVNAYDAGGTRHSIVIGAGTRDDVRVGQAVCALGTVIGTVMEVGPWRSKVRLLTDPDTRLPCRVTSTRKLCLLEGDGTANCSVRWIDRDSEVARGDVLVTAPVGDALGERPVIPPGLPVAIVQRAKHGGPDALFLDVSARPSVDVSRLEAVEVVVPKLPSAGGE
ncbi:MAG: rod shape-determining protein MreC [Candidatus Brocadiia bacterium]|jgi:rod shape-determining protein MreC|nr:rod shape-determining protein MreC [Candidatus Brocadiia bacterium]